MERYMQFLKILFGLPHCDIKSDKFKHMPIIDGRYTFSNYWVNWHIRSKLFFHLQSLSCWCIFCLTVDIDNITVQLHKCQYSKLLNTSLDHVVSFHCLGASITAHDQHSISTTERLPAFRLWNFKHKMFFFFIKSRPWWRHDMERFSVFLDLQGEKLPSSVDFPHNRPVMPSLIFWF